MTEAEARAALRAFVGIGDVEPWIAERPWQAVPGGWTVAGKLQGWRFRLEVVPSGVRVVALAGGGGEPAAWVVPGQGAARVGLNDVSGHLAGAGQAAGRTDPWCEPQERWTKVHNSSLFCDP